jgi:5-methyltetrahydrofolate--homocysteine methyltransferase
MSESQPCAVEALTALAAERILILDGAMGTQIQALKLGEDDYTGHGSGQSNLHPTDYPQRGTMIC